MNKWMHTGMKAKPETVELPEHCHLSLSLFLGLRCIACVVLPGGTNIHLSPSAPVNPSTKIKRGRGGEAQEAYKRIGEVGGVGRVFVQA
jgi:hypothetical protein